MGIESVIKQMLYGHRGDCRKIPYSEEYIVWMGEGVKLAEKIRERIDGDTELLELYGAY